MDINQQYRRFFDVARSQPADEGVPCAFENRVMARIRALGGEVPQGLDWARGLLVAVLPCAALMLLATAAFASVQIAAKPVFDQPPDELALAVLEPIQNMAEEW